MPTSDFSAQMAQMIAQARPKQVPTGGGRSRIMGGAGGMGIMGKESQVSATVDIGPWMRLFGYKTPEEKQKTVEDLQIKKENTNPEQWELWESSETGQTVLKSLGKTAGTYKEESGRWKVMTRTPEAATKGLTGEQIIARGGAPAERLTTYGKEMKTKTETEIFAAGGSQAETLLKNKEIQARQAALAAETPAHEGVLRAQADMYTAAGEASIASAKKDIEVTKYIPEEQIRVTQESKAKVISLKSEAKKNNAQADYYLSEAKAKKEESKTENIILKGSIDAYRTTQNAWISAYAKGSSEERTQLMGIMTGATERYITSMSTLKKPELGNEALSFWLSSTNDELSVALEPETGKLPTKGMGILGPKKVQPKSDMLFQQRASQIVSFMQSMGSSINDNTAYKSLDLFTRIYKQTTHTPQMNSYAALMVEVGKALGYPMTTLQNLITPPKTKEEGLPGRPLEGAPVSD